MSTPIPIPPGCSSGSAAALVLRPERSRLLALWWLALHLLLLGTVAALGFPIATKSALAAALAAHAWVRRPRSEIREIVLRPDDRWDVPVSGARDLRLDPRSGYTWLSIRLVLVGDRGKLRLLLLKDQFDDGCWRALQERLARSTMGPID